MITHVNSVVFLVLVDNKEIIISKYGISHDGNNKKVFDDYISNFNGDYASNFSGNVQEGIC